MQSIQYLEANQGGRVNLGYTLEELRTLTPMDITPEFSREAFEKILRPLRSGKSQKVEYTSYHKRKNGSQYPVVVYLQLSDFHASKVFVIKGKYLGKEWEERKIKEIMEKESDSK